MKDLRDRIPELTSGPRGCALARATPDERRTIEYA